MLVLIIIYCRVFACALLLDEQVETYEWVLETLLEAVDGQKARSVLIDGDKARRKGVKKLFPSARYRICSWHLKRNVHMNIYPQKFVREFNKCITMKCTQDAFEAKWEELVHEFNLEENKYIKKLQKHRGRQAESY